MTIKMHETHLFNVTRVPRSGPSTKFAESKHPAGRTSAIKKKKLLLYSTEFQPAGVKTNKAAAWRAISFFSPLFKQQDSYGEILRMGVLYLCHDIPTTLQWQCVNIMHRRGAKRK